VSRPTSCPRTPKSDALLERSLVRLGVTGPLPTYPAAIKKEFGRRRLPTDPPADAHHAPKTYFTPHRVVPSIQAPESNNILGRLNGTSKDRTKTMRAYDNDRGASALSEGWQVHYNMVRDHLALGTTPGAVAGLPQLQGFRWRSLIDLAIKSRERVPQP
jgi:hypothetical protein